MLLNCHRLLVIFKQADFTLSELSIESFWTEYGFIAFFELSQAVADLYTGWFYSIWTAYWVSRVLLNCLNWLPWMFLNCHRIYLIFVQGDFTLSELSIRWLESSETGCIECGWTITGSIAEPYAGWFYSTCMNCLLGYLTLGEPPIGWIDCRCSVFLVTLLLEYLSQCTIRVTVILKYLDRTFL